MSQRDGHGDDVKPWDLHPDLTEERLITMARILIGVWKQAASEHAPERGDDWWVLCCRCYQRSTFAIAAASESLEWLKILDPSRCFHFALGEVPMRIYHGEPEQPNPRTLRRHHPELHVQQMLLARGHHWIGPETFWRIAVETDNDGEVSSVFLVQCAASGNPLWWWLIPAADPIAPMPPVAPRSSSVELPRPSVSDRDDDGSPESDDG